MNVPNGTQQKMEKRIKNAFHQHTEEKHRQFCECHPYKESIFDTNKISICVAGSMELMKPKELSCYATNV